MFKTKNIYSLSERLQKDIKKGSKTDWTLIGIIWLMLILAFVTGVGNGKAYQTEDYSCSIGKECLEFNLEPPEPIVHWKLPHVPMKANIGADVQEKIRKLYNECVRIGMTEEQALWTLGMADHESGGTWSESVKGDGGCSTGIGQWNSCPGSRRKAAPTFDGQVDQLCSEMKEKFDEFPIEIAVGKHNAPAWDSNPRYVERVIKSKNLFK
jgi:hypothetical protein